VRDDAREPVEGAMVSVIGRFYHLGQLRYRRLGSTVANENGAYRIPSLPLDERFLVQAVRFERNIAALSDEPADESRRKETLADTFDLTSTSVETAVLVSAPTGNVDIRMVSEPAYCAEGVTRAADGSTASLPFTVFRTEFGLKPGDSSGPAGSSAADGKFRICNLAPGDYSIVVQTAQDYARASFTIGHQDVPNIEVTSPPLMELPGEIIWDGSDPVAADRSHVSIRVLPLDRESMPVPSGSWSETEGMAVTVPAEFHSPRELPLGDYEVSVDGLSPGQYVKEITYGGGSVLHQPLRLGSALGVASLHIVLARDGGALLVQAVDALGKPAPDA
jgi:hypothetical protein